MSVICLMRRPCRRRRKEETSSSSSSRSSCCCCDCCCGAVGAQREFERRHWHISQLFGLAPFLLLVPCQKSQSAPPPPLRGEECLLDVCVLCCVCGPGWLAGCARPQERFGLQLGGGGEEGSGLRYKRGLCILITFSICGVNRHYIIAIVAPPNPVWRAWIIFYLLLVSSNSIPA